MHVAHFVKSHLLL